MVFKVYDEESQKRAWNAENEAIEAGIKGGVYTIIGGTAMGYTIASMKRGVSLWTMLAAMVSGGILSCGVRSLNDTRHLLKMSKDIRAAAKAEMDNGGSVICEIKDDIQDAEPDTDGSDNN